MNIRNMLRFVAGAITVTLLAVGTQSYAQPSGNGPGGPPPSGQHRNPCFKQLNLTEDQKAQIKALGEKFKTDNAATIQEMKQLRDQLKELKQSGSTDKEAAKAIIEKMKADGAKLREAKKALDEQILSILTPEQREQLKKCREQQPKGPRRGGAAMPEGDDLEME